MNFELKVVFNPRYETVEVMWGGQAEKFRPGEKKLVPADAAYHFVHEVNAGLKYYEAGKDDEQVMKTTFSYASMPWRDVVSLASKRKLFKPGMGKEKIYKALIEDDNKRADKEGTRTL